MQKAKAVAEAKASKPRSEEELIKAGYYKGYDISWLRRTPDHPEFNLVAEFDEKYPQEEEVVEEVEAIEAGE